jgi:hypothetical protein
LSEGVDEDDVDGRSAAAASVSVFNTKMKKTNKKDKSTYNEIYSNM